LETGAVSDIAVDPSGNVFSNILGPPLGFSYAVSEYPVGMNSKPTAFYIGYQLGTFGFTVERGRLYVTADETPGDHFLPPTSGWFTFDVANPSAGAIPYLTGAGRAYEMTAY
jgi:hypothetical protein